MDGLKKQTFNGVKWYLIGDGANIVTNFIIGLILARLLTPDDYGTIGVYGIFFALANIFINGGFSMSLIQKKDINDVDCSTAFWSNIIVGAICYIFFFFLAPLIADFFKIPLLKSIIRVSALGLLIGSFTVVQTTLFNKCVDFRTTSTIKFVSNLVAGITCILLAYNGLGVWSLVIQGLAACIFSTILLWTFSSWRPKLYFSWISFNNLFSFGGRILGTRLLETLSGQFSSFVIGKAFSPVQLGYYQKGAAYARLLSTSLSSALFGVLFPVMSKIENKETLTFVYRKYIQVTSMVIFFLMLLLFALGRPIIVILYTVKWEPSAAMMQIVVIALMFDHIIGINNSIFNVKGRGDILLRLQVIKTITFLGLILLSIQFGVYGVCFAEVIYYQIAMIICGRETKRLIGYGYLDQMNDVLPYIVMSSVSVIPAFILVQSSLSNVVIVFCGSIISIITYIIILYLKKDQIFMQYIWSNNTVKSIIAKFNFYNK